MSQRIPVQKKKLYEELIDQFSTLLNNGDYVVGDKLPSLNELAEIFNVGKASLREALSVLTAAGVLEIKHGSGIYLRKFVENPQEEILLQLNKDMDNDQMLYWFELRRAIEVEAVGLAARRRTDEDIHRIEQAHLNIEKRILHGIHAGEYDHDFHYQIALAAHNPVLAQTLMSTSEIMKRQYFELSYKNLIAIPSRGEIVNTEHKKVLEAIKAREVGEARKAMLEHIHNAIRKQMFINKLIREKKSLNDNNILFLDDPEELGDFY